jgi:4-hydroxy-tetrahydrodipicolinate synthase|tara:strand:+ start:28799 stop:29713 length:915 start_codon:yes stop_codon:yes gene_type:complete
MTSTFRNVLTPVLTPFDANGNVDLAMLERHCRWLANNGSDLAIFGTNSEGTSLSVAEKRTAIDHLVDAGIEATMMMPGTGSCSLPDTVETCRHAVAAGCGGVLLLPPFYYKDVSDEGLFRFIADVIMHVDDARLKIYLYHIPPVAQIGYSFDLIARLIESFPDTIVGIKDSSGDFAHTKALIATFPDWSVYCGNELDVVEAMSLGAAGCISATCNINAGEISRVATYWNQPDAAQRQAQLADVRRVIAKFPMIAALKAVASRFYENEGWHPPRPPLLPLSSNQRSDLYRALDKFDYSMRSKPTP